MPDKFTMLDRLNGGVGFVETLAGHHLSREERNGTILGYLLAKTESDVDGSDWRTFLQEELARVTRKEAPDA